MEYFTHEGILYELLVISLASEDGYGVELTDMSATGGLLAEVRVANGTITPLRQAPMPAAVYARWTAAVIELAELPPLDDEVED